MILSSLDYCLHVGVVFFLFLHLVGPCTALDVWDDVQGCYENVTLADSNHDRLLDMNDFLNLIKLYNNTCDEAVVTLSATQLDLFMKWSKCSCISSPFTNKTCCTAEESHIHVPYGDLLIFEQVGLALLCKQASLLSSYMECRDALPIESPSLSDQPSISPSQRVVNKEITSFPTQSNNPQLTPPYTNPTDLPSLALQVDDPTLTPTFTKVTVSPVEAPAQKNPTNFPSQAVYVDEPTIKPSTDGANTYSPISLPVANKEIPVGGPPYPLSIPSDIRPTTFPSIALQSEPTQTPVSIPVMPPLESPTGKDALCINSMRLADSNGDQKLTFDEYVVFLRKFIQCTGIQRDDSYVADAFSLTRCFPNPKGCITENTLDIATFYISSNLRKIIDDAEIITVCDVAEGVGKFFLNCVDLPTPEPSSIPAVPTYPPIDEPVTSEEIPSAKPFDAVTGIPSKNPLDIPPNLSTEVPVVVPTLQPAVEQGQDPPEKCVLNLSLADSDDDSLLTQEEFLTYISLQPGCDSITSLSSQQINTFSELAALCLDEPDADELCTQPRNARVSIVGIYDIQTKAQRDAISYVCSQTEDICAALPIPISPPAPAAVPETNFPISPQAQLPTLEQPTFVVPDDQVPSTPAPNQVPPIVRTNSEVPAVSSPVGTGSPAFYNVDKPSLDSGTSFPAVSQSSAPLGLSNQEPVAPPSLNSASPPLGVEDTPPVECVNATLKSDSNQDSYLFQDEYLSFIQIYSKCDLINILSAEQRAVFQNLACSCLNDPAAGPDCCLPGNAKIYINGSRKLSYETYSLSEICFLTAATFDDECLAPPTVTPIEYQDLDQCSNDLVSSDTDKNDLVDKEEYLLFIQKFGQCEAFKNLDLGHYSVFQTMACECVNQGASFECCLPGNATLNISGASLQDSNRTVDQISMLSKICITANGLTTRPCEAANTTTPMVDCADNLLAADDDSDEFLDMNEYLFFLQATYANCSGIEWLSLSQRVVFNMLACACLLDPGAELECCFPGNARINITGARIQNDARTSQQSQFLSTLCTASNAVADIGCRTALPTPAPTSKFKVELTNPPAITKTSAIEVTAPEDVLSLSNSQSPLSKLRVTSAMGIIFLMVSAYVAA